MSTDSERNWFSDSLSWKWKENLNQKKKIDGRVIDRAAFAQKSDFF
jgi:hypothetical protein